MYFCGKFLKRFNDHLRLCKLKHLININTNNNRETGVNNNANNKIIFDNAISSKIINKINDNESCEFLKIKKKELSNDLKGYKYFKNYLIGSGGS